MNLKSGESRVNVAIGNRTNLAGQIRGNNNSVLLERIFSNRRFFDG